MSFGVYPRERTSAAAPLTPSAFDSCCVKAGSGAVRVVVVPPLVGVPVVCVGVDCVPVVCVCVCVEGAVVACDTGGAFETVTVFVDDPHAASNVVAASASISASPFEAERLIAQSYSPPGHALLARRITQPRQLDSAARAFGCRASVDLHSTGAAGRPLVPNY